MFGMTTGSESLNISAYFIFDLVFSEKWEQMKYKSHTHSLEIN
jgi:hypothetical protein